MITQPQEDFTLVVRNKLWKKGTNITQLALKIGFARNTVSRTINHPTIHPVVKAAIKKELAIK